MFHVSASESTSTGTAPTYVTGFTDAAKVNEEQITSSYERIRRALAAADNIEIPITEV